MSGVPGDALDPQVWPAGAEVGEDGAVRIAGVDLRSLAAEHGTPAYVLDEADFRRRARAWRTAFEEAFAAIGAGVDVYYAGKAFLSVAVARWAHEEGLRIDTATGGELAVALRAGVPGEDIGLHGNNKSDAEIDRALAAGVGRIVLDSLVEVDRVAEAAARAGVRAPVMVRVTTGVHAGGHEYISTAHEDQKFGLSVAGGQALEALRAVLARPELELLGIHSHIGSQILDPSGFEVAARRILELRSALARETGVLVSEVDLGGGYGVAYVPGEVALDPVETARAAARAVGDECARLGDAVPRISIEPGRAVVGPTTVTLYTVGTVKPVTVDGAPTGDARDARDARDDGASAEPFVRTYVSVDGGMSDNLRPALYGARYSARVVSRRGAATTVRSRVVGKHCESGDVVVHDVELPSDVRAGDLLAVPVTGAYGRSMASNYNHVPRPPVVAVRDGAARVVVRRETEDDLLALDLG
ncbi:diaminopimelate decarboxylase [Cellulomonas carbonis]|uniref:Diaminopimelate decarboxylase n=1 Tax=Cellulomonas carbonis T26 TaxID=947969 RepID=A0A0A0BRY3_9CELL|nr:diaminopimelate decarboxylase [Cellulomonas carbonis]KGM10422.1 diaminopimelate decarboxylase [Cellulomonas carbonis T26]GGC11915.1 diaminopimelate decarboxylase [Cellulomonas carbonis]